jgi:Ca2+-binding RTX toxin-like protein
LFARTQVTGGEAANDDLDVQTLAGADTVTGNVGVSGLRAINVDGGADADSATYQGGAGADSIGIAPNGTAVAVAGSASTPFDLTAVERLDVQGLGADDTITGANGLATLTSLTLDGGFGDDTLRGGDGADTLLGGPGNDLVDGNRGNDVALLDAGNDTFQWDPGDGSDTVEGGTGNDNLNFNGANIAEKLDVSANGGRVRVTRDVGNIVMDLNDVEHVALRTLGGADDITVNDLTGTDVRQVSVDLSATGGGGDGAIDTVRVEGTANPDNVVAASSGSQVNVTGLAATTQILGAEPANDTLRIETLGGKDVVRLATGVTSLIAVVVDLGTGQ